MIRLSRQEKFAAGFFGLVAAFVWTGSFVGWFGSALEVPNNKPEQRSVTYRLPIVAVGDGSIQGVVNDVVAWQEAAAAAESQRSEVVRMEAVSGGGGQRLVAPGDCSGIAEGFPAEIAWRESRCTIGIDTGNGYLGYAQIARFHWNGGLCSDLDWSDLAQYNECVTRLWNGGAGASHWAVG